MKINWRSTGKFSSMAVVDGELFSVRWRPTADLRGFSLWVNGERRASGFASAAAAKRHAAAILKARVHQ